MSCCRWPNFLDLSWITFDIAYWRRVLRGTSSAAWEHCAYRQSERHIVIIENVLQASTAKTKIQYFDVQSNCFSGVLPTCSLSRHFLIDFRLIFSLPWIGCSHIKRLCHHPTMERTVFLQATAAAIGPNLKKSKQLIRSFWKTHVFLLTQNCSCP